LAVGTTTDPSRLKAAFWRFLELAPSRLERCEERPSLRDDAVLKRHERCREILEQARRLSRGSADGWSLA
jgi:hypothetical protein